jgi:hypothetical protein
MISPGFSFAKKMRAKVSIAVLPAGGEKALS